MKDAIDLRRLIDWKIFRLLIIFHSYKSIFADYCHIKQEYVRDLEKEEEEKRKILKVGPIFKSYSFPDSFNVIILGHIDLQEQIRRAERKNRDEFRRLMEDHVATGVLTAKTQWRDYFAQVICVSVLVSHS